jgi:hypothetical protein
MNARRIFLGAVLIIALYSLVQAQYVEDKYLVKIGDNVMRVVVSNRTQAPLSGLTLKFAESLPPWFSKEKEETFDIGAQSAALVELPFQVNTSGALTEAITLQLLAQEKLLGTFAVKLTPEGALGRVAGESSSAGSALEERLLDKTVEPAIPLEFALRQNYPNPFNPATFISYSLPDIGTRHAVSLRVFDVLGRELATLVDEMQDAGFKTVRFEGRELPSGLYIYRLVTPGFIQTRKMLLVR